ncbi:hypothetical protein BZA70DRAFT_291459 [Myxozyma melibiosi]|uniref:Uncharacterized protein n=1 Tax=Myxozyma melibiosi TaxID=54550 RepID=A0ABR1F0Q5_9ASCO
MSPIRKLVFTTFAVFCAISIFYVISDAYRSDSQLFIPYKANKLKVSNKDESVVKEKQVTVTASDTAKTQPTRPASLLDDIPAHCDDPYLRPGFLRMPWRDESRETYVGTRWIPYYNDVLAQQPLSPAAQYPNPDLAQAPELIFKDSSVPTSLRTQAPYDWMSLLYQFTLSEVVPIPAETMQEYINRLSWLRNKRVLMLGDSVDRVMIYNFCKELKAHESNFQNSLMGKHTTAYCRIPSLNFTIIHWHFPSMLSARPDWWWIPYIRHVPFEERVEKLFLANQTEDLGTAVAGMNGRAPDLIIYQSLLWDWMAFNQGDQDEPARDLFWSELDFYRSRLSMFVDYFRNLFGADVPMMYRAVIPTHEMVDSSVILRQLDTMARHVADEKGVEVFEWGHTMDGYLDEYRDKLHVRHGPHSYLYANMLLYYLFRAVGGKETRGQIIEWPANDTEKAAERWNLGKAWEECHPYNMRRASH